MAGRPAFSIALSDMKDTAGKLFVAGFYRTLAKMVGLIP